MSSIFFRLIFFTFSIIAYIFFAWEVFIVSILPFSLHHNLHRVIFFRLLNFLHGKLYVLYSFFHFLRSNFSPFSFVFWIFCSRCRCSSSIFFSISPSILFLFTPTFLLVSVSLLPFFFAGPPSFRFLFKPRFFCISYRITSSIFFAGPPSICFLFTPISFVLVTVLLLPFSSLDLLHSVFF